MRSTSSPRAVSSSTGILGLVAQAPQHFKSVQTGQHDVEHDQQKLAVQSLFQTASPSGADST